MPKFRKKPVVIEAVQFTGDNFFEVAQFLGHGPDVLYNPELHSTDYPIIHTLEGKMEASPGDWVIKGVKGEFYPCKPDIFAATYDPISEDEPAPKIGWAMPGLSKKFHYFIEGRSLCGKWAYSGTLDTDTVSGSPDDCSACRKALAKEKAPATA